MLELTLPDALEYAFGMRCGLPLVTLVMWSFGLAGCGSDSEDASEDTLPRCEDGLDNDGDGHADCDDQDCEIFAVCGGDGDADADADTDSDSDTDGDGDTDADTDGDGDADADGDADGDGDCEPIWSAELVDDAVAAFLGPGLVVDALGSAHVAYADVSGTGIFLATNESGDWVVDPVDDALSANFATVVRESDGTFDVAILTSNAQVFVRRGSPGAGWGPAFNANISAGSQCLGLAIDEDDAVHVAYSGGYATNASGDWVADTPDMLGANGVALGLASDGSPHIAYTTGGGGNALRHTAPLDGEWADELVDDSAHFVGLTVRFDAADRAHIVYWNVADDELRHATLGDAGWEIAPIDTGTSRANGSVSFVLDAADALHLVYSDQDGLAYATDATGAWVVEPIAPGGYAGSIVLGDGVVRVAYISGLDGHVHYAERTCD